MAQSAAFAKAFLERDLALTDVAVVNPNSLPRVQESAYGTPLLASIFGCIRSLLVHSADPNRTAFTNTTKSRISPTDLAISQLADCIESEEHTGHNLSGLSLAEKVHDKIDRSRLVQLAFIVHKFLLYGGFPIWNSRLKIKSMSQLSSFSSTSNLTGRRVKIVRRGLIEGSSGGSTGELSIQAMELPERPALGYIQSSLEKGNRAWRHSQCSTWMDGYPSTIHPWSMDYPWTRYW
ncbi:hypothetical protein K469DRAFT_690998 [Zopfia rhizophila CBS 207.26]|uniref:Uncharacterized protein n=1 Tax=Zopfia rhizophila CBS 207.26 TaxID=1314779 RepID=A0A6A6EQU9_9PEZI|nr:hypothetical protein K469DRAFT_690998 [Zopfia rhizophila CBS 207.26]